MIKSWNFVSICCCLWVQFVAVGQEDYFLTPQDKAYLFHTVRKSPILEQNIGRYIEYVGREARLPNGELNYDSVELMIINNPDLLIIRSAEIRKAPKGILAEAANKQAIWELNKTLHAHRTDELEKEGLTRGYERFEKYLIARLPHSAIKKKAEEVELHPKVKNVLNPSLAFNDKVAMMDGVGAWSPEDKKQLFDAINYAINKWVEERAFQIFEKLGGQADQFINVLTAAGDGSLTSGLFEEREKDERGRWNQGLPKAIGLFPYESEVVYLAGSQKKANIEPMRYSIKNFESIGQGRKTNIHLDVWGYNSEKQTTVVIEKREKSYPLFGSTESRFLSPDSSFTGKTTYYTMINRVSADIAGLEEKISGKKGLDYWIAFYEKRKSNKLLEIDKTEKELSDLRMSPITTNDRKYTTKSGKKKRKKRQEAVVRYYSDLEAIKRKIAEYEAKKQQVLDQIHAKEQQKTHMLDLIGRNWVSYVEKDGLYVFEDSTTFDLYTQEFVFPESYESEPFEIRLIAIPYSHTSNEVDEVMLHINITDALPNYDAKINLTLNDMFESGSYELKKSVLTPNDSLAVREFFEVLLNKEFSFDIKARGNGVGKWNGFKTIKDTDPVPMISYPGSTPEERAINKMDSSFLHLRTTQVEININRAVLIEINSFTDPVKSNFIAPSSIIQQKAKEYNLSNNEVLSAYRSYSVLKSVIQEMNILAGQYLDRPDAKIVIDRLNKQLDKTRVLVGAASFKWKELE